MRAHAVGEVPGTEYPEGAFGGGTPVQTAGVLKLSALICEPSALGKLRGHLDADQWEGRPFVMHLPLIGAGNASRRPLRSWAPDARRHAPQRLRARVSSLLEV